MIGISTPARAVGDRTCLEDRHVQRVGRRQHGRQQPGQQGTAGRRVDREERLLHREHPKSSQTFSLPSAACSQKRPLVTISPTVEQIRIDPPVEHVGQRAAVQTEDDEWTSPATP